MTATTASFTSQPAAPKRQAVPRYNPAELAALKQRDNVTNFGYLAIVYAVIISTLALSLWAFSAIAANNLSWWWYVPVVALAALSMGGSQHQFGGAIHEGTHYTLFANRTLNELAGDWLAAFPIYTSTHAFRLHHLAHHQFVNDPERDPNFAQAKDSGHWLDFPLTHIELLVGIAKQLNPVRLVSYILARAKYSALGVDSNPYADVNRRGSPWSVRVGVMFAVGAPAVVIPLVVMKMWTAVAIALPVMWLATMAYYWNLREDDFPQSRIEPVISHRATALNRIGYMGLLYTALCLAEYATGAPAWGYFALFWLLPLFTTFPLFMVMREWLQHGNADRGRLTNSRVIYVNPIVRYMVFPWGMDIHVPHHLFASIPHYRLQAAHDMMMRDPDYARTVQIVQGWSQHGRAKLPTIVDVLGPEYTPAGKEIHVDDATLEHATINAAAKAAIDKHAADSRAAKPIEK